MTEIADANRRLAEAQVARFRAIHESNLAQQLAQAVVRRRRSNKQRGTAHMLLEITCGSAAAAEHFTANFAKRARGKTVEIVSMRTAQAAPWDFLITVEYKHTCINEGAARSDARRFIRQAFTGTSYRYEHVIKHHRPWKPAPDA